MEDIDNCTYIILDAKDAFVELTDCTERLKDAFAELTDSSDDQIETHEQDWMRKKQWKQPWSKKRRRKR